MPAALVTTGGGERSICILGFWQFRRSSAIPADHAKGGPRAHCQLLLSTWNLLCQPGLHAQDCNLVLYNANGVTPADGIWSSNTATGDPNCKLLLHPVSRERSINPVL